MKDRKLHGYFCPARLGQEGRCWCSRSKETSASLPTSIPVKDDYGLAAKTFHQVVESGFFLGLLTLDDLEELMQKLLKRMTAQMSKEDAADPVEEAISNKEISLAKGMIEVLHQGEFELRTRDNETMREIRGPLAAAAKKIVEPGWREEFDKRFEQREIPDAIEGWWSQVPHPDDIKSFISRIAAQSEKKGREAAVDYIGNQLLWGGAMRREADSRLVKIVLDSARTLGATSGTNPTRSSEEGKTNNK